jgi:two-component system, LytTR family, response regulator AlgR
MRMQAMIVDDEPLARQRLSQLLGRLPEPVTVLSQWGDAGSALAWLEAHPGQAQLCFLDIQMPGPDGLHLAAKMATLPQAPLVVFVTAHAEHACHAFDLQAIDYLTKPVRIERLEQAVARCRKQLASQTVAPQGSSGALFIQERQRVVRVPYSDILYLKAELKYVTVRTAEQQFLIDDSLSELQDKLGPDFIRIHRNALVARATMRHLARRDDPNDPDSAEGWAVQIGETGEWLTVSRRQVSVVRDVLTKA